MSSALSITQSANPARVVFLDYPLGHTAGQPDEPDEQLDIMRAATAAFASVTEPGGVVVLPHEWPQDWKPEARELKDHRTTRHDTPQYQTDADREAATSRYSAEVACDVCVPELVPRN